MSQYLTKSKFVRALDCPTKLYYKQHKEYKSTLEDDEFLQALAEGGLQVGELAKLYFPGGHDIPMMQDKAKSMSETNALLQQESVTIYEAAIKHENCFILVDILQKKDNRLDLIEVKSKSWEPGESFTYKNKDDIYSDWQEYLFDVAFQTWVARRAYPDYQIEPYLMLIDKTQKATVDGLHQYFKIVEENGQSEVRVKEGISKADLGTPILRKVHVGEYVVLAGLFKEMKTWTYPLHFIDFEAVTPAIPFHKGQKPYKKTPFQFSCHTIYEDGSLEHTAEWIEDTPGKFPCFDFVRELKKCLEGDNGSVFMYHHFENTVLNDVIDLLEERQPDDANELMEWIQTITKGGPREMIDQQRMVVKYYYSPYMGGSNSIKDVLPAVLNESPKLKELYLQPYSGLSIKDKVLYKVDEESGLVVSPYKLLDPIGYGIPDYETAEETITEGGTAMMAWSRMQFDDITPEEREATFKALLEYCELDTLAMVMIYQHWEWLRG